MAWRVIPNARFRPGIGTVPRATLEETARDAERVQITVAAKRAPLPVPYGLVRVGGLITYPVLDASGNLLVPLILGRGPIDAVTLVEFDNQPLPAGVTYTTYTGAAGQGIDPWLAAAWLLLGVTYADTLPGVAYIVLKVPPAVANGFNNINVTLRGRKVQDPRIFPAWRVPFDDAGAGVASMVAARGSGVGTFTRAGATATTILSTGLISSAIAADTLRSYYDPTSLTYRGAIFEEERTNLMRQSAALNLASANPWVLDQATASADATAGPDGATTAEKLVENTVNSQHVAANTFTAAGSVTYSNTIFAKSAGNSRGITRYLRDVFNSGSTYGQTSYNIDTGAITFGPGKIKAHPSGWYRLIGSGAPTAGTRYLVERMLNGAGSASYLGDGSSGAYLTGAQVEACASGTAFATTYIPTTTAAVTRNKDLLRWPCAGNVSANDCTLMRDWTPLATSMGTVWLWGSYVDASNYTALLHDGTNVIFRKRIAGVNYDATKALTIVADTTYRLAWRLSSTDGVDVFVSGVKGTGNSNTTAAQLGTNMEINADGNGTVTGTGCCREIRSYLYALTDAEVATDDVGDAVLSGEHVNRVYSDNPALAYADLITESQYFGRKEAIDWDSVATCADVCDEIVNTEKRRRLSIVFLERRNIDAVDDTLRDLAGVWKVYEGATAKLVADVPRAPVYAFVHRAGSADSNVLLDSLRLTRRDPANAPTVFRVRYTDQSVTPWAPAVQEYALPGVDTGALPFIDSNVEIPGIPAAGQAYRAAIRRGKESELCDTNVNLIGTDAALALQKGDNFTVSDDARGLNAKPFTCTDVKPAGLGRFDVVGVEYQSGVFSDAGAADPVIPDTGLPNPNNPPPVTGLAVSEVLIQKQGGGVWVSSIRATWTNPNYGPRANCVIEITQGGSVVASGATANAEAAAWQSGELKEALPYLVNVYTRSSLGALSVATQASITLEGKGTLPGDPLTFTCRELGGKLFAVVTLPSDPSIAGVEIRELPAASSDWDDAAGVVIYQGEDRSPVIEGRPAGSYRYAVKTRDNKRTATLPTGQYSTGFLYADVTITLDTALLIRERYVFGTPSLSNMTEFHNAGDPVRYFITDHGDGLGFGADDTNNATGTFADSLQNVAFAHPHTSGTSSLTTETFDFGQAVQADWNVSATVTDIAGSTHVVTLQLKKLIGDAWTDFTTFPARGEYRYARLVITAATTNTMQVAMDSMGPLLEIDAVVKQESFEVTSSATLPVTVTLQGEYSQYKSIVGNALESAMGISVVIDNISLSIGGANEFDVYAFDDAGNQVAADITGIFIGI